MLDYLLDLARIRQFMDIPLRAQMLADATRNDIGFLNQVRRGFAPLPWDGPGDTSAPFPADRVRELPRLEGQRVAVIGTGGSGALAALLGVAQVLHEAGIDPVAYGVCSGSALFGVPLAAGLTPREVAEATLSLSARDYIDPDWTGTLTAPWRLMKGWAGLLRGQRLEDTYRELLGEVTLGGLPTPTWIPVWNIEGNRLEYLGPDTHPELSAARAVRLAVALPMAMQPVALDGGYWLDGGIVDILPAEPFVGTDRCDVAIVVNGFYGPGFTADERPGWQDHPLSLLQIAHQTRMMQHLQIARRSMADLQRTIPDVIELNPVPYSTVHGAGLYGHFLDTSHWRDFMAAGYVAAGAVLTAEVAEPDA